MIEVSQLHKSFGQQQVLRGVNMKIDRGESVVIIGGSGCGKSAGATGRSAAAGFTNRTLCKGYTNG